jgi:hypothetical protein
MKDGDAPDSWESFFEDLEPLRAELRVLLRKSGEVAAGVGTPVYAGPDRVSSVE